MTTFIPALTDDKLVIKSKPIKKGAVSGTILQQIWRGDDLMIEAKVTMEQIRFFYFSFRLVRFIADSNSNYVKHNNRCCKKIPESHQNYRHNNFLFIRGFFYNYGRTHHKRHAPCFVK